MLPIRPEIDGLLLRGVFSGNEHLVGMCRKLHDHCQGLWTFLDVEGVEPTNNASAPKGYPALRPATIWRKLSLDPPSAADSGFVETILTVVATCSWQSRNSVEYLTTALKAHFAGLPAPRSYPAREQLLPLSANVLPSLMAVFSCGEEWKLIIPSYHTSNCPSLKLACYQDAHETFAPRIP